MPQVSRSSNDEDEYPNDFEGIDWSLVTYLEGDEKGPQAPIPIAATIGDVPASSLEPPPRPLSSTSSYGFADVQTLDDDDLAILDQIQRLAGGVPGEFAEPTHATMFTPHCAAGRLEENGVSTDAQILDPVPLPGPSMVHQQQQYQRFVSSYTCPM
jgi:hypothetical protein